MKNKQEHRKIKCLIGIEDAYTQKKITDCFKYRHEYDITIFDKNDIKQQDLQYNLYYDFYWLEYEDLDFETLLDPLKSANHNILINSFCIRKGLIRKAQMAFYLKKYLTKKKESVLATHLPETYIFELDYLDYFGKFFLKMLIKDLDTSEEKSYIFGFLFTVLHKLFL
jgi:tubulin--tyrosine ligase